MVAVAAPPPRLTVEAEPFIPYVAEGQFDPRLLPILAPYKERMGFVPNAVKLYAHRPEIASVLWSLNDKVMRDPSSTLDQYLKRRLAAVASMTNGCAYCTAHSCSILKSPRDSFSEGWALSESELQEMLAGELEPKSDFERVAFEYVRVASEDPTLVPDDLLASLKARMTPPQIIELACLVGFWKFYNTVHDSLHIPVESHLLKDTGYVDLTVTP